MASPETPPFLVVGHVRKAHGTTGEVAVEVLTDTPEMLFAPGARLRVAGEGGRRPDGAFEPLTVEAAREHRGGLLVRLEEVPDRNAAEELRGRYLLIPFDEAEPAGEDEFFYHDLLGMTVVTVDGRTVGEVTEVFELQPAHLLEVRAGGRTHLVPFSAEVVETVDPDEGVLVVDPPEGLLDL